MGNNSFAPFSTNPECFIVQNISPTPKTIFIFNYPINYWCTRDLLRIPGVAESDIRSSLLKGELNHKIRAQEITILCSDIDLLQFNDANKAFLTAAGITKGLEVPGGGNVQYLLKQAMPLMGAVNGTNRVFTVPPPDKFLEGDYLGNQFHILVSHNGHTLQVNSDYVISESGGIGTGYDTITFISFTPLPGRSQIRASYVISV